jgi:uncharacterized protein DUF6265
MPLLPIMLFTALAGPNGAPSSPAPQTTRPASAPVATAPAPMSVTRLAWLAGCWASLDGEPGSDEHWMSPAGGSLLGASRTVRKSRTVGYEFMIIRETDGGGMEFVAQPSAQAEASFPAVNLSEKGVVFENPTHDFPQLIGYQLLEDGTLSARIEGNDQGQRKLITYPMRRVDCPGPPSQSRPAQR